MPKIHTKPTCNAHLFKAERNGFTLVEMLIVITIIGVLAGSLLSVINFAKHKKNAEDGVKRANLEKLVTAIESYRTVEGRYPSDPNADGNPSDDLYISNYVKGGWIVNDPPGTTYTYYVNPARDAIRIVVNLNSPASLKYTTEWSQIKQCAAGVSAVDLTC